MDHAGNTMSYIKTYLSLLIWSRYVKTISYLLSILPTSNYCFILHCQAYFMFVLKATPPGYLKWCMSESKHLVSCMWTLMHFIDLCEHLSGGILWLWHNTAAGVCKQSSCWIIQFHVQLDGETSFHVSCLETNSHQSK